MPRNGRRGVVTPYGRGNGRKAGLVFLTRAILSCAVLLAILGPGSRLAGDGATARGVQTASADSLRILLRARLADTTVSVRAGQQVVGRVRDVARFHAAREFAPVWTGDRGALTQAREVANAVSRADSDGLLPAAYHAATIDSLLARTRTGGAATLNAGERADLEILLTDAFLSYAHDLTRGKVEPRLVHGGWTLMGRQFDGGEVLTQALYEGDIAGTLGRARPRDPEYEGLRIALSRYRAFAERDGWPEIPAGPTLRLGDSDSRVPEVVRRLALEKGRVLPTNGVVFDAAIDTALRAFQSRHGLEPDGALGRLTLAALNVSGRERVQQIEANLERIRWLPSTLPVPRIEVNVAAQTVRVVDADGVVLEMRAIVGRADWPTPVFQAQLTSLVLSPYWNVPSRIAALEVIPAIRRNPGYLQRNDMEVVTLQGGRVIDPGTIDWANVRAATFPYRIRQRPGPGNPLGIVKFVLPNTYDVFLHDTPGRAAFARDERALSHGCVRLENAFGLTQFLLAGRAEGAEDSIRAVIAGGRERTIRLERGVPVILSYRTAWPGADGAVQFRTDIYGHDQLLTTMLAGRGGEGTAVALGCGAEAN